MISEEVSRVNRQPMRQASESKGSGLTVVLIIVILLNVVALGSLIYLTIDGRAAYDKQAEKIVAIESRLAELSETPEKNGLAANQSTSKESRGTNQLANTEASANASEENQDATAADGTTQNQQSGTRKSHIVTSGDTLSVISDTENISIEKLRSLNDLTDDVLQVGQELVLE